MLDGRDIRAFRNESQNIYVHQKNTLLYVCIVEGEAVAAIGALFFYPPALASL